MEKLITSGVVDGVLDATVAEVLQNTIPSAILDAGPDRLEAAGRLGIPQVVSLGGLDSVCFGPWSAVPPEYRTRHRFENNKNFIALRTSEEECIRAGKLIATKLNKSRGPVTVFIPRQGLSQLSIPGNALSDPDIDQCLFQALRAHIDSNVVTLIERDEHINDTRFGQALADALHQQLQQSLRMP